MVGLRGSKIPSVYSLFLLFTPAWCHFPRPASPCGGKVAIGKAHLLISPGSEPTVTSSPSPHGLEHNPQEMMQIEPQPQWLSKWGLGLALLGHVSQVTRRQGLLPKEMEERCVCVCVLVTQSCLTLHDSMNCSPPGSSVKEELFLLLQARILEWVAISFSRGSS